MSLSERIRPNVEAAPWVIEEVKRLEAENAKLEWMVNLLSVEVHDWEDHASDHAARSSYLIRECAKQKALSQYPDKAIA